MVIIIVTYILSMFVGYLGYFAFGSTSKSLILYNLPSDDPLSLVAQAFYILTIAGSFVLMLQPIFHVIENSEWYQGKKTESHSTVTSCEHESAHGEEPLTCCQWVKLFSIRLLIIILIVTGAFLIPNLNLLLTVVGTVFGLIIAIILPVLFYNRAYKLREGEKETRRCSKVASWVMLVVGSVISCLGLGIVVYLIIRGDFFVEEEI